MATTTPDVAIETVGGERPARIDVECGPRRWTFGVDDGTRAVPLFAFDGHRSDADPTVPAWLIEELAEAGFDVEG